MPALAWPHRAHIRHAFAAATIALATAGGAWAAADPVTVVVRPDWFAQRSKALDAKGFPDLSMVPRASGPGQSDAHWSTLAADIRAEGDLVLGSPRNVPADLKDLESFEAEARKAVTPPPALGTPLTRTPATTP